MARHNAIFSLMLLFSLWAPISAVGQEPPAGPGALDLQALFAVVGEMYGVDPSLLASIAAVESDNRSGAVSPAGAMGLMQLMPSTARQFQVDDAFDPIQSVLGAARFLADLKREQQADSLSDLPRLIAAYNAGEGAVERYRAVPPYPETVAYVRKVLWRYLLDEPVAWRSGASRSNPPAVGSTRDGDTALLEQLARLRRERARAKRSERGSVARGGG